MLRISQCYRVNITRQVHVSISKALNLEILSVRRKGRFHNIFIPGSTDDRVEAPRLLQWFVFGRGFLATIYLTYTL